MQKDELTALAERVMTLAGPNYAVDCEVWDAVYPGERAERLAKAMGNKASLPSHEAEFIKAPPLRSFTSSLEAAMTMVPEGKHFHAMHAALSAMDRRYDFGRYVRTEVDGRFAEVLARHVTAAALLALAEQVQQ